MRWTTVGDGLVNHLPVTTIFPRSPSPSWSPPRSVPVKAWCSVRHVIKMMLWLVMLLLFSPFFVPLSILPPLIPLHRRTLLLCKPLSERIVVVDAATVTFTLSFAKAQ